MIIELQRAFSPEEMAEEACGICGELFRIESVVAQVGSDPGVISPPMDLGHACRACIEALGRRGHPERFPTIEEYEELLRRYPDPIWGSSDDAGDAWHEDDYNEKYEASWVWRAPA